MKPGKAHRVRRVDPAFATAHGGIPWDHVYGMRNRIDHDYLEVDLDVVWQTVMTDLPPLRLRVAKLLASLSSGPPGHS